MALRRPSVGRQEPVSVTRRAASRAILSGFWGLRGACFDFAAPSRGLLGRQVSAGQAGPGRAARGLSRTWRHSFLLLRGPHNSGAGIICTPMSLSHITSTSRTREVGPGRGHPFCDSPGQSAPAGRSENQFFRQIDHHHLNCKSTPAEWRGGGLDIVCWKQWPRVAAAWQRRPAPATGSARRRGDKSTHAAGSGAKWAIPLNCKRKWGLRRIRRRETATTIYPLERAPVAALRPARRQTEWAPRLGAGPARPC